MDYENAFLGLILGGVLLMIAGLGLMMPSANDPGSLRLTAVEKRLIETSSLETVRPATDGRPIPSTREPAKP